MPIDKSKAQQTQVSPHKSTMGIGRIFKAMSYALSGIQSSYANEAAFRQESWMAVVLILINFFLPVSRLEHAMLMGSVLLVLICELLNSAIEAVVDRVGLEEHELSRRAKDAGSAAVLMSLLNIMTTWGLIVWGVVSSKLA